MGCAETISVETLRKQDDETTTRVIHFLRDHASFHQLSVVEGNALMERDCLDREKLRDGISYAINQGILPPNGNMNAPQQICIMGKSSEDICDEIIRAVAAHRDAKGNGQIISLQGLSGTGKGTTVRKLSERLPQTITWSNGNVFRCLTYCLLRDAVGEAAGDWPPERIRNAHINTTEIGAVVIAKCMGNLEFVFRPDEDSQANSHPISDIRILPGESAHPALHVSEIQNTLLKYPNVSRYVPLVAEKTQGEVIRFTQEILHKITVDWKWNVLIEGRSETLNYIDTPHRFELVLSTGPGARPDTLMVLGQRRAAQRVVAEFLRAHPSLNLTDEIPKSALERFVRTIIH
ncbi:hypothetical protein XU18_2731 [Perkinsela sp. CCAP 1560/4]|nr:hypothetical protein XU18_2731 [Perkinsela sp. CCAP 1560/4]|eukprot:KNH06226.1 hypothetical protein XU18_2731 [Perkinsela sp. CCAP 1560/4]